MQGKLTSPGGKEMPVTITLNDELAARLQSQAQARRLSLEQWALTILGHATDEREWSELQAAVAKALEPWDR
jgi:predicted transcriptional regulator